MNNLISLEFVDRFEPRPVTHIPFTWNSYIVCMWAGQDVYGDEEMGGGVLCLFKVQPRVRETPGNRRWMNVESPASYLSSMSSLFFLMLLLPLTVGRSVRSLDKRYGCETSSWYSLHDVCFWRRNRSTHSRNVARVFFFRATWWFGPRLQARLASIIFGVYRHEDEKISSKFSGTSLCHQIDLDSLFQIKWRLYLFNSSQRIIQETTFKVQIDGLWQYRTPTLMGR
jgi:hypothetical protein